MRAGAGGKGRPPTLKKTTISLDDGSEVVMRLIGDGDAIQIVMPESWSLAKLDRSIVKDGGRTQITLTKD
jgi:hypothetical protein